MTLAFNQQWVPPMAQAMSQDEKTYFKALGERVAQRRQELGLTQVRIAEALGVAQQTYASYEVGRRRIPVSLLPVLADALSMETDILLGATTAKRATLKRGPVPVFQQHIERISQLPKAKQRFVIQMLETVLAQQGH